MPVFALLRRRLAVDDGLDLVDLDGPLADGRVRRGRELTARVWLPTQWMCQLLLALMVELPLLAVRLRKVTVRSLSVAPRCHCLPPLVQVLLMSEGRWPTAAGRSGWR